MVGLVTSSELVGKVTIIHWRIQVKIC